MSGNTTDHLFASFQTAIGDRFLQQLKFLAEAEKLKTIIRATPLLDRTRFENDAEHTWQLTLMAVMLHEYADPGTDLANVLKMLIVHDLVEVYAGDTPVYDVAGRQTQKARETVAADQIFGLLPPDQRDAFKALWVEFDAAETADAAYANAIDRLQPFLHNYLTGGESWRAANRSADEIIGRNAPVQRAMTALWPEILNLIARATETGMIRA